MTTSGLPVEPYCNPEIDDRRYTLDARHEHFESDVIDKLARLSEEFATALTEYSGNLLETTDFRPPRCTVPFDCKHYRDSACELGFARTMGTGASAQPFDSEPLIHSLDVVVAGDPPELLSQALLIDL